MMILVVLAGITAAVMMAGFFSGLETAAYRASHIRLRRLAEEGDARARQSLGLLGNLASVVTTTLIGHNLAVNLATFLLTRDLEHVPGIGNAELAATILLTPFCFLMAEVVPKRLAYARAEKYVLAGVNLCHIFTACFLPLAFMLGSIARGLNLLLNHMGLSTRRSQGRERLLEYLEASAAEQVLTPEQHRMALRIMAIDELNVGDIMIPAARAVCVREDMDCAEAARVIHRAGLRRALLADKGGRLVGMQISLDRIMRNPASMNQPVRQLATEMLALDVNTPAGSALRKLKQKNTRMALATGKGGSPVGVVTASDLLGRVVGAMQL